MTIQNWQERSRPIRLFLDDAANLSEQKGFFPDIGFGKTYANFTIHSDAGSEQLSETQREFAELLDKLESAPQA